VYAPLLKQLAPCPRTGSNPFKTDLPFQLFD
jgi:hypothetical protein